MLEDWLDEKIARAWGRAVAEHGDVFQQAIVKPFVLGALMAIHENRSFVSKVLGKISARAGHNTYRLLGNLLRKLEPSGRECTQDMLAQAWKESLEEQHPDLTGLRLLDLGGGEGYLGRWLADHGAHVTSVDGSDALIEIAKSRAKQRKSTRGGVRLLKGDLTDATPDHQPSWLRPPQELCNDEEAATNKPSTYDAVVCTAVLDHLDAAAVRNLLGAVTRWVAENGNRGTPLVVCTLNPDFFYGAGEKTYGRDPVESPEREQVAQLGPARQQVKIFPRSWLRYEQFFADARFHVLRCDPIPLAMFPAALLESFYMEANLDCVPAGGPFVCWSSEARSPAA